MNHKNYIASCVGLFFAVLISLGVSQTSLGQSFDRVVYDTFAQKESRANIIIVGIDDASLQHIGSWPWERSVFAKVVSNLKEARVIAFDILFLEARAGDAIFQKKLQDLSVSNGQSPSILMASKAINNLIQEPIYENIETGLVHVIPENDGVVRSMSTHTKVADSCLPNFGYQVFALYTKTTIACSFEPYGFSYIQNPKVVSLKDVYNGQLTFSVKDAIIFIGATSLDMGDMFVGPSGERIPGVLTHASFTQSLLDKEILRPIDVYLLGFYILISCIAVYLVAQISRIGIQLVLISLHIVITFGLSALLFGYNYTAPYILLLLPGLLFYIYEIVYRYIYVHKKNIKIGALFGSYVNTTLLQSLLKEGDTVSLGGARKRITVLFSDIRDFTTFSEAASPEHLVATMNTYFSYMTPAVTENLGTIDKYIGDAIMAFWNAPLDVEHHEERAVQAALAMRRALEDYNKASGNSFKIGIGIHAGEAVVGNIGSKERISYTALGDTVNVSSRVEGLTKQYGADILVTQEVVDAVQSDRYTFTYIDTISVKGRGKQVILYTVTESI